MTPFRFGPPTRRLYGVYHPGDLKRRPSSGVLLCNPYGQEAIRIHRLFRLLAERLSRNGIHVLRFDYFATGESDGEDAEGDMMGWNGDLLAAHAELLGRARCERVVWAGARLGGTLALGAAAVAARAPDHLLLWEPIVDGEAYVAELGRTNAQALHDPIHRATSGADVRLGDEATGFAVGAALRAQLDALSLDTLAMPRTARVTIMTPPSDAGAGKLSKRLQGAGCQVDEQAFVHQIVWGDEEAMNSALAPSEAIEALQAQITAAAA